MSHSDTGLGGIECIACSVSRRRSGRIHTSAVAVMPEADDVEVSINEERTFASA